MTSPDVNFPGPRIESIEKLSRDAEASDAFVKEKLSSRRGRFELWRASKKGRMPEWAKHHFEVTRQFERAMQELMGSCPGAISRHVLRGIDTGTALAKAVNEQINKEIPARHLALLANCHQTSIALFRRNLPLPDFAEMDRTLASERHIVDADKLLGALTPKSNLSQSLKEWHLNLGLLMSVYQKTENAARKKQIGFLILNYLAKAAPISLRGIELNSKLKEQLERLFQLGLFQMMCTYHRQVSTFETFLLDKFKEVLPSKVNDAPGLILTDTSEMDLFFPTRFAVLDANSEGNEHQMRDRWTEMIASHLIQYLDQLPHKQVDLMNADFLEFPLLLDLTNCIGDLWKKGKKREEDKLDKQISHFENLVNQAIKKAVKKMKQARPGRVPDKEAEKKIAIFIRMNLICLFRAEIKGMAFIKTLPLFSESRHYRIDDGELEKEKGVLICVVKKENNTLAKLNQFADLAGVRLGAIRGRERIFNFVEVAELIEKAPDIIQGNGTLVEYAVRGKNIMYFPEKRSILTSQLFKRFKKRFSSNEEIEKVPVNARVLGEQTLLLIEGLLEKISEKQWIRLNANPETREIVQFSLYRMMMHLGDAEDHLDAFASFTQAIELVHCELATLLTLASPFGENEFQAIYKEQLDFIPSGLLTFVQAGISRSAMTTFAGIVAIVKSQHPDFQIVCEPLSYYEEMGLIGAHPPPQGAPRVDLYVGEFNHNINLSPLQEAYQGGDIQGNVENLLKTKPGTEHLTVAVDCTIDSIRSDKVKSLLKHFKKEIKEGKLNFIFFRSGQKFDMLGMDNYYGGTFYLVNNGSEQWEPFNVLLTHQAFKTDPLSVQWFCLVHKYAPEAIDKYYRQIVTNTRAILKSVPKVLLPRRNPNIKINRVDPTMEPCFIDIRVLDQKTLSDKEIELLLHQLFARDKVKIYSRASFGFYNPNINIMPGGIVRLNPGLNPEEVKLIIEFLNELAKKVEQLGATTAVPKKEKL